jgi:hypothetical protein
MENETGLIGKWITFFSTQPVHPSTTTAYVQLPFEGDY